jgi:hypothetical protein
MTARRLYEIWRQIANHTFTGSHLAPWDSLGAKHKKAWEEYAERLQAIDWAQGIADDTDEHF